MFDKLKDWVYQQHCLMGTPAGSTENVQWVEISRDTTGTTYIPIRYTQFASLGSQARWPNMPVAGHSHNPYAYWR